MCVCVFVKLVFVCAFQPMVFMCLYLSLSVLLCCAFMYMHLYVYMNIHMCNEVNASVVSIHMYVLNEGVVY